MLITTVTSVMTKAMSTSGSEQIDIVFVNGQDPEDYVSKFLLIAEHGIFFFDDKNEHVALHLTRYWNEWRPGANRSGRITLVRGAEVWRIALLSDWFESAKAVEQAA